MLNYYVFIATHLILTSLVNSQDRIPSWEAQNSNVDVNMRGISAVSDTVAWASGPLGTVIRTVDGGQTWEKVTTPEGLVDIDYRDIEAFDENTAVVLGVGTPAYFFCTRDGGQTWKRTYFSDVPGTFYNAMDFWDENNGIAFGDAIDGRITILTTNDGGDSWQEAPLGSRPEVTDGQYAFAASGTCLRTRGDQSVFIVLGSKEPTVLMSHDRGQSWNRTTAPIQHGTPSSGIFSIDFKNDLEGIVVGGDFNGDATTTEENAAITTDGGYTWQPISNDKNPNGYRSAVAYFDDNLILAAGKDSCDYSMSLDEGFVPMDGNYYAVSISKDGSTAFASGPNGNIGKLKFN